eukprot:GAHX01003880.1.p1 GENE.GAHX01003880.1~~GAHX01003880.1.p1  ORF type:complete len:246 (+),score=61.14 GAHX01003880.1:209-946(+)
MNFFTIAIIFSYLFRYTAQIDSNINIESNLPLFVNNSIDSSDRDSISGLDFNDESSNNYSDYEQNENKTEDPYNKKLLNKEYFFDEDYNKEEVNGNVFNNVGNNEFRQFNFPVPKRRLLLKHPTQNSKYKTKLITKYNVMNNPRENMFNDSVVKENKDKNYNRENIKGLKIKPIRNTKRDEFSNIAELDKTFENDQKYKINSNLDKDDKTNNLFQCFTREEIDNKMKQEKNKRIHYNKGSSFVDV